MGGIVVAIGIGLLRGRFWSRTPGIVVQAVLLLSAYSMLGPSRQVLVGALVAALVIATLMLLLSEPARRWSFEGDPGPPAGLKKVLGSGTRSVQGVTRLTWSRRGTPRSWPRTVRPPASSWNPTPAFAGRPSHRAVNARLKWPCPTAPRHRRQQGR